VHAVGADDGLPLLAAEVVGETALGVVLLAVDLEIDRAGAPVGLVVMDCSPRA